jgi:hypothetical protein
MQAHLFLTPYLSSPVLGICGTTGIPPAARRSAQPQGQRHRLSAVAQARVLGTGGGALNRAEAMPWHGVHA